MITVKPLEWEELSERCWDADGMGKLYRVMKREDGTAKLKHGVYDHGTEYPSLDAAKSAAFSDYSARIMSAIEPAGVGVETEDYHELLMRLQAVQHATDRPYAASVAKDASEAIKALLRTVPAALKGDEQ